MHKIAIDTVFFKNTYSGISRVWDNIINNLHTMISSKYEIILLIRNKIILERFKHLFNNDNDNDNDHVKLRYILINDFEYFTMYQDVDYLNSICAQHNITHFISTYYTYCTIIPNILMIHDMIPEIYNFPKNHMWIQKELCINNASHFITISNTTTNDLIKYYPHINTNYPNNNYKITKIYNSISRIQYNNNDQTLNDLTNIITKIILPKKYIFAIATNNEEYKNIKLLTDFTKKYISKLSQLLQVNTPIVLLVKNIPNNYIISNGILYISNINDNTLDLLYKNALCFINPSKYEGFGLSIFEAFTHKTPVIALDLPIYKELLQNNDMINYIENDSDDLYDKICRINTAGKLINKRINDGYECCKKYTLEVQMQQIHNLFNELDTILQQPACFLNIMLQSYDSKDLERQKELEYCIIANLNNPYIAYVHDFGYEPHSYLPDTILKHPKYINTINSINMIINNTRLTYKIAFTYAEQEQYNYGMYWGLINCDIFLDTQSKWLQIRGQLNNNCIYAQSRHEFNPSESSNGILDPNFAKLYHANTQDAWFFKTPMKLLFNMYHVNNSTDFEIGKLGCDNAIADRLFKIGYTIINQPITFKIMHYDISRGKNSSNYLEKHKEKHNTHPERQGAYLVPNYNTISQFDLQDFISSIGGISDLEKYQFISQILSKRIIIINP